MPLIPIDPEDMLTEAEYLGAAPDGAIDPDTETALRQKRMLESGRNFSNPPASAYVQTNHGLQALPTIENDD